MTPRDLTVADADDTSKPYCLPCAVGLHADCLYLTRPTSCACLCPWLIPEETQ